MHPQLNQKKRPTKPRKLSDPGEHERILMMYAGIFPNNIKEYADTFVKRERGVKDMIE